MTTRDQRLRELQLEMYAWECENLKAWERRFSEELAPILNEPVEVSDEFLGALTRIYAVGYLSGHEDTVEGRYTDVVYSDRPTYHRDVVTELLLDSDYAALNLKEPGQ